MWGDPGRAWTPQQVVRLAVAGGPAGPLGRFHYSNTNYIILGMIAQTVTGEPIQELITTRILRPPHLYRTSFATVAAVPHPVVHGYGAGRSGTSRGNTIRRPPSRWPERLTA